MGRLLSWNGPVIDPGSSLSKTPTDAKVVHTYRAVFDVPVGFDVIVTLRQMPQFFSPMVFNGIVDNSLFVVDQEVVQIKDAPNAYDIRITYANRWTNSQNPDKPNVKFEFIDDPTLRPALVTGGTYTVREAVTLAYPNDSDENTAKVPPTTTAGEPLIIEEEYHRRMFTITKNVRVLSEFVIKGGDWINSDVVEFGTVKYPKATLLLFPIHFGHISVENGFYYFPLTMTLLHNPKGWVRRVRNAGYYMRGVNTEFRVNRNAQGLVVSITEYTPMLPIRFKNGSKPDRPILLNKKGQPIQMVITGEIPDPKQRANNGRLVVPGNPQNLQVRMIKEIDIQSPEDFGRAFTEKELTESELKFRTFQYIQFNKNVPFQ